MTKSGTSVVSSTIWFSSCTRAERRWTVSTALTWRVLPYSNQQLSGTFGGPIVKDRVHFFGGYEYDHQPTTYSYNSPYKSFNVDVNFPSRVHKFMGRLDYQFSTATHL